ncbi:MAG: nuclear transport factor 2 family protein [Bryobacterales bacterium]|jgi:uncharacterized protein (TIGR02246 family)|nr:nuclear transport factor 2 family protein [Bryobacterales bacterium]
MRFALLASLLVMLFGCAPVPPSADPRAEVLAVMESQQAAWNAGDLNTFLDGYQRSADITFVGREVARGFDGLQARYQRTYGDREKMGTLTFSELEHRALGADAAMVLGRFALARSDQGGGPASGRFTVVFRNTPQGWKIIHDHTSAD